MANEFVARKGLISLSTSSFYGPVNFSGSSLVGIGTGSVLFTNASGSVTGSGNLVWDNVNGRLGIGTNAPTDTLYVNRTTTGNILGIYLNGASRASIYSDGFATFQYVDSVNHIKTQTYRSRGTNLNFASEAGTIYARIFETTGNLMLQNGGTFTDGGYRLDVNGSGAASGSLRVSGSSYFIGDISVPYGGKIGASASLAPGSGFVGTQYSDNSYRIYPRTTSNHYIDVSTDGVLYIKSQNANGIAIANGYYPVFQLDTISGFQFYKASVGVAAEVARIAVNGNMILKDGNITDLGYRLSINPSSSLSGSLLISGSTTQPATLGNTMTSVNIIPTMVFTTGSQTQTAFKVMPTFSGSAAFTSSQTNIIADFGATSVGSQLIVTDVTSGSIYMVNDVSGIPIIEANSNWDVLMYDYPYTVFKKTGSAIELGVTGQASSSVTIKSDLVINEGLGFTYRQAQASGSTNGAVTSSLYNIQFTNTSASVYINAIVTGYDTGSRDTIAGDIKATIRYRSGVASIVGIDQTFINTDNSVVGFDIVAGGTSGSLVAFGTGSRVYQWGATITTQVI